MLKNNQSIIFEPNREKNGIIIHNIFSEKNGIIKTRARAN